MDANAQGKRVVITYGTFDLFHLGHKALLERAKMLGDYLIVGVTSDAFDVSRGKLNVRQALAERIKGVEESGIADMIVVEEFKGQKIDDIRKYGVSVFAIGSDWEGKFDYLKDYCEVVYLPRTPGISSTELREELSFELRLACIGDNYLTARIVNESRFVSGLSVTSVYVPDGDGLQPSPLFDGFEPVRSFAQLAECADAVYINAPFARRIEYARKALEAGLHVLYEGALGARVEEVAELFDYAGRNRLVLMEALQCRYFPAFQRLKLLLESGIVGEVKDIDASFSQVPAGLNVDDVYEGSAYNMATRTLLPAAAFLGSNPLSSRIVCGLNNGFCEWVKFDLVYENAAATLKAGRGIKTEGDMTITGTDGYIYVPAPWWKLEYFEIRYEDLRNTKKHFYELAGEGHRYMLKEFFNMCANWNPGSALRNVLRTEALMYVSLIEKFDVGHRVELGSRASVFGGGETVVV